MSLARYSAVSPVLADGANGQWQIDQHGRLLVNAQPILTSWIAGGAALSERVLVAAPTRFFQIWIANLGASTEYCFIFDAAALGGGRPGNGATSEKIVPIPVAAGAVTTIVLPRGLDMVSGLAVSASSTAGSFTYDSSATLIYSAEVQ